MTKVTDFLERQKCCLGKVVTFVTCSQAALQLKTNVQPLSATEAQELFDGVEARSYDRIDGAAKQTGFVAQEVYESGALGKSFSQAQELRAPGAHDAGLPADDGGALADLQEPAAEDREAREEEARALELMFA